MPRTAKPVFMPAKSPPPSPAEKRKGQVTESLTNSETLSKGGRSPKDNHSHSQQGKNEPWANIVVSSRPTSTQFLAKSFNY